MASMRFLFLLALAALALLASPARAEIVPDHGNYEGSHGLYEVKFHFDGAHITHFHLIKLGALRPLKVTLAGHAFTANDHYYAVLGEWTHARQVHCRVISLSPPRGIKATFTAHLVHL
jgi:hypothetical protein